MPKKDKIEIFQIDFSASDNEQDKVIVNMLSELSTKRKIKIFQNLGVGKDYFTCNLCGNIYPRIGFLSEISEYNKTGVTRVCNECAKSIARPTENKKQLPPTKETMDNALYYLDKPFLDDVWKDAEKKATEKSKRYINDDAYTCYMQLLEKRKLMDKTYRDSTSSPSVKLKIVDRDIDTATRTGTTLLDSQIYQMFEQNKADVVRLLGYSPFDKEALEDQPFLYSELLGYLDVSGENNDDRMRISSIIVIVRGFLQQNKNSDYIASLMRTPEEYYDKLGVVSALQKMNKDINTYINNLAKENCISLKNSKSSIKGDDTWTGKIKKLKELQLREQEINSFDIGTCAGMRQVADISHASIISQIKLDENDYTEMLADQRTLIEGYRRSSELFEEQARILLRENLDLKEYMSSLKIDFKQFVIDDPVLHLRPEDLAVEVIVEGTISKEKVDDESEDEVMTDDEFAEIDSVELEEVGDIDG